MRTVPSLATFSPGFWPERWPRWQPGADMCGLEASWPPCPRPPPTPGVEGPRWLRTPWRARTPEDGPAPFDLGRTARREQAEVGRERPVAAWTGEEAFQGRLREANGT